MILTRSSFETAVLLGLLGACGGAGASAPTTTAPAATAAPKRSADVADDCEQEPGKPAPEPLRLAYTGVAKAARCQREVYTIMGGVTHFLGVKCNHCHTEPDYAADTHNKQVANWMARELVPKLVKRAASGSDGAVWCNDCHAGKAKLLGDPRQKSVAIEWMTTHLVADFDSVAGKSIKCRQCHVGDLGSPQFQPKIMLSELAGLPAPAGGTPTSALPAPSNVPAASSASTPSSAPAASSAPPAPVPDFGAR